MCENVMAAVKKVLLKMYEGVNSVVLPASIYTSVIHPSSICPASKTLPRNILGPTWSWVTRFRLNRSVKMTFSANRKSTEIWRSEMQNLCSPARNPERTQKVLKYPTCHRFLVRLAHRSDFRHSAETLLLLEWCWCSPSTYSLSHVKILFVFLKSMSLLKCQRRKFSGPNIFNSRVG